MKNFKRLETVEMVEKPCKKPNSMNDYGVLEYSGELTH